MPGRQDIPELRAAYDAHQRVSVSDALSEREEAENAVRYLWRDEKTGAVLFSHDSPLDLRDRLMQFSFEPDENEAVMVLDVQSAPQRLLRALEHDVRRATTRREFREADSICQAVWGGSTLPGYRGRGSVTIGYATAYNWKP